MPTELIIRRNEYQDSMVLMQINHKVAALPGVSRAAVLMATEPNKQILADYGFTSPEITGAKTSDMVIGLETNDDATLNEALELIDRLLVEKVKTRGRGRRFATLAAAAEAVPESSLVLVSTPGQFAAREAQRAIALNKHVFIFSDNVPLDDEVALKKAAGEKGLLVMGPDCGTAIIDGKGLGFANRVNPGPVGLIGASGSGMQEICVLLDAMGLGISQAIGLGGRDLSEPVGGATCRRALEMLAQDPASACLVVVSKPPSPKATRDLLDWASRSGKPVVLCLLGLEPATAGLELPSGVHLAASLEQAALMVGKLLGKGPAPWRREEIQTELDRAAADQARRLASGQGNLRGLFSGGSLCYEALALLRGRIGPLFSNLHLDGVENASPGQTPEGHLLLDLGDDEFTMGRVHPMIDPSAVAQRILSEAGDPQTAVVLFDVVLGHGAHPDPASLLVPALKAGQALAAEAGRHLICISHVCGTEQDPQELARQTQALQEAGCLVCASNQQAVQLAESILTENEL